MPAAIRTIVIRFSLCVAALVLLAVGCSRDEGLTAVERAARANQPDAVLLLLEYGAAADRYWVSGRGILRRLLE